MKKTGVYIHRNSVFTIAICNDGYAINQIGLIQTDLFVNVTKTLQMIADGDGSIGTNRNFLISDGTRR